MLRDRKVPYRSEESLSELALGCRRFARNENRAWFNVIDFVEQFLPAILSKMKKGPLKLQFFDAYEGAIPAYVEFNPLTLHIDREIWGSRQTR